MEVIFTRLDATRLIRVSLERNNMCIYSVYLPSMAADGLHITAMDGGEEKAAEICLYIIVK